MNELPLQSKMPGPLPALLWSLVMVLMAALSYFSGGSWNLAVAIFFLAAAAVLWFSVLSPTRFLAGVRRVPGGLEIRAPLQRRRTILFDEICQIDAVSLTDVDTGEPVLNLLVRTMSASALLEDHDVLELELLADFRMLPSFNAAEYEKALLHHPSDFREPFGKRFVVLSVP